MKSLKLAAALLAAAVVLLASASQAATQQTRGRPILRPSLRSNTTSTTTTSTTTTTTTTTAAPAELKTKNTSAEQRASGGLNLRERSVLNNNSESAFASGRLEFVEDELPADFYEMPPEQLDLGMNATGRAPVPILNVAVLQNGQMVDSAINVHPGTPLEMVIYLDDKSAKVYGLLASYLKVQDDTFRQREEVIISNGCSIDTYIFGNFEHNPEDQSLRAKFRAFKFPDSNFVRFVGTVNVCIKQCAKVNCNGGRRKRASIQHRQTKSQQNIKDDKLVFTVSTVLRISK